MAKKIRINNDILVEWTVNLHGPDGTLVDLTSLNLGVQLIVGQKLYEVQNPTIAANLITFLYPGADQHYDGPYVVKLYDKDNTTITYDVCNAFILTDSSWTADSAYVPEDITVEIETDINAVQIVAIAGPKGDKGDKGDTGAKGDTGEDGADGANGKDGEPGRSIRKSVFEVNKMYYNGEVLSDDGVYYLDIVTDTAVAMADEEVNYYVCKDTHLSTVDEDLEDKTLWTHMSEMDPIVTPLVLAKQIDAEFIDVDNLYVKHIRGGTGDFAGEITAESGEIIGTLSLGEYGKLVTEAQYASAHINMQLLNNKIVFAYVDNAHGDSNYWAELGHEGLVIHYDVNYSGAHKNNTLTLRHDSIIIEDSITDTQFTPLFCANGGYNLEVLSTLPSSPSAQTIYIITSDPDKGLYVGSTKIA